MKTKDKKKNAFVVYVRVYPVSYIYTEWPKKMYTLFTHQNLWNKFK